MLWIILTWEGHISKWVGDIDEDSCCWQITIGIFWAKLTLFKFVLEVEGLADRNSWVNEYLEVGTNSIWIVPSVCCMIFEGVVRGLIRFGLVRFFNSHWPPWVISFHLSFLGT